MAVTNHISRVLYVVLQLFHNGMSSWDIEPDDCEGGISAGEELVIVFVINPYPTAFPYGNGMVLHFYQQQESSTTKTVHKDINKGLKGYV